MSEPMAEAAKQGGTSMTVFGVITIILGVLAMFAPMAAGLSMAVFFGILLFAGGIVRMLWSFKAESLGQGILKFAFGGLTLLCGLLLLARPLFALASLTLILAAYFLVDGLFEIVAAFRIKPERGWGFLLFGGIVSLALGIMIWRQFPSSATWVVGIMVGVKLIFAGMEMLTVGTVVKSAGRTMADAPAE